LKVPQLVDQFGRPLRKLYGVGILQDKLVLRPADGTLDRQILDRLHIEGDAGEGRRPVLDALHHRGDVGFALIVRLEVDQNPAAVERGIGSVDPDE